MRKRSVLSGRWLVKRSAFLLPFFVFAGLFKDQPFSLNRAYLDLTFWLATVLSLFVFLRKRFFLLFRKHSPLYWILLPLAIFILLTPIISSINGEDTPFFGWKVFHFLVIVVPAVLLCYWHLISGHDWAYFRKGILWLSLYTSVYLLTHSVLSMWGHINYLILGVIPGIGGVLVFYEIIARSNKHRHMGMLFFLFGLFTLGVFHSYARGEQVTYLIVLAVMLLFENFLPQVIRRRVSPLRIGVGVIISWAIIGSIFFLYQWQPDLFLRFQYVNRAVSIRISLFRRAIDLFAHHPILPLGIGGYYYDTFKYPHNILLELMAEMGIWGGAWYVLIVTLAAFGYWRYRKTQFVWEHFYIFLFLLFLSWKEGSVFESKAFWVWTAIGIGLLDRNARLRLRR